MGVFASSLTREALWEAFLARRVYAATGDKIDARLFVDDAWIGSTIKSNSRRSIRTTVNASDAIDRVELIKNGRIIQRFFADASTTQNNRYRLRITWGWGRKDEPAGWNCQLNLSAGAITSIETCFSGQSVAAPKGVGGHDTSADEHDLPHAVIDRGDRHCAWRSITTGNLSLRHPTTQAISFEVEAPDSAGVKVEVNGQVFEHSLADLLHAGRSHYLRGWLSEAIRIGPLVQLSECQIEAQLTDEPELDVDYYRLQVAQKNGQWAWLSPIWVERL